MPIKMWRTVRFAPDRADIVMEIVTRYDDGFEKGDAVAVAGDPALLGAVVAALTKAAGCGPYFVPVVPSDPAPAPDPAPVP